MSKTINKEARILIGQVAMAMFDGLIVRVKINNVQYSLINGTQYQVSVDGQDSNLVWIDSGRVYL